MLDREQRTMMWLHAGSCCGNYQSRIPLSAFSAVTIGRRPDNECAVTWDPEVSRQHARLEVRDYNIELACLQHARNPLYVEGSPTREATLSTNSTFQIGKTVFCVTEGKSSPWSQSQSGMPADEEEVDSADQFAYDSAELRKVSLSDSADQMQVLCDLPEIAAAAGSDIELAATLADTLLHSIPQAIAVAAIECESLPDAPAGQEEWAAIPLNMRVATKEFYTGRFRPSRRLMAQALQSGKSVVYCWDKNSNAPQATISDALNWAFCVPLSGASRNWCLYVSGEGGTAGGLVIDEQELKADLKFTQVLGRFIASFRHVRQLQEQKTRLSSFFSPKVIESLTGDAVENALSATESEVTVLFCDVRGFSRKSEEYSERLPYLLECVRAALGVMTQQILRHEGAIADFQGDAALGFWGWPLAPEQGAVPACLAALAIQTAFSQASSNTLLEGFSVGLGIAHGRAIAGQIGTADQAKIGVFGPVVNQGARLESMTRQFDVSIIIDEATMKDVRRHLPESVAIARKLAHVRPKGMKTIVPVYELVSGAAGYTATDQFESAVAHVVSGDWDKALELLDPLPNDGPRDFLIRRIHDHGCVPPVDWDGAFSLSQK